MGKEPWTGPDPGGQGQETPIFVQFDSDAGVILVSGTPRFLISSLGV